MSVSVKPIFADEQTSNPRSSTHAFSLKSGEPDLPPEMLDPNNPKNPFYDYHQRLKQEKEKQMSTLGSTNQNSFIAINKRLQQSYQRGSTSTVWNYRTQMAQKSREEQSELKIKLQLAKSVKWSIIRRKKEELLRV